MASLTSLLYPISATVTALPGDLVNNVANIDSFNSWNEFNLTTTPGLTSRVFSRFALSQLPTSIYIAGIDGISFAPYDQYLQIWTGPITWDPAYNSNHGTLIWSQIIKSNQNFNFEFSKGILGNPIHVVNSTTPLVYTQGNNDIFATVRHKTG